MKPLGLGLNLSPRLPPQDAGAGASLVNALQTLAATGGVWAPNLAGTSLVNWYDVSNTSSLTLVMGTVVPAGTTPPAVTLTGTPTSAVTSLEIDITTGGARGTAIFTWKLNGVAQQTGQTTAATFSLGSTGVTANFPTGTPYATNNVYTSNCQPSQWNDLSGNAYHLLDPGSTLRFNFSSGGWPNGNNAIIFPGATNVRMSASSVPRGLFSIGAVFKCSAAGNIYSHGSLLETGGTNPGVSMNFAGTKNIYVDSGVTLNRSYRTPASTTHLSDNAAHATLHTMDGTNAGHLLQVDGVAEASYADILTGNPGSGSVTNVFYVGNEAGGFNTAPTGLIAEIVMWAGVLSAGDAASWHNYCRAKWGTP